jgi:hypothetical protein
MGKIGSFFGKVPKMISRSSQAISYAKERFNLAYQNAVASGQYLGLAMASTNLFNNNTLNINAFSLGTVLTFHLLTTLYDLKLNKTIGDVYLFGGALEHSKLCQNLHKLIGYNGVVQGKLYIFRSSADQVLNWLFTYSGRDRNNCIGHTEVKKEDIIQGLLAKDKLLRNMTLDMLGDYVEKKLVLVDCSLFVKGHLDYRIKYDLCDDYRLKFDKSGKNNLRVNARNHRKLENMEKREWDGMWDKSDSEV